MNLDAEDQKLVTLARGACARVSSTAGACVRDQDGRTYSAAAVTLGSNSYDALELAVITALMNGAKTLEAGCIFGSSPSADDVAKFRLCAQPSALLIAVASDGTMVSV